VTVLFSLESPILERPVTAPLLERIRAEYMEMPGLTLTAAQAQRLWGLDGTTCRAALDALVEAGFLSRTDAGESRRPNVATRCLVWIRA
jgi:hypothetical protein